MNNGFAHIYRDFSKSFSKGFPDKNKRNSQTEMNEIWLNAKRNMPVREFVEFIQEQIKSYERKASQEKLSRINSFFKIPIAQKPIENKNDRVHNCSVAEKIQVTPGPSNSDNINPLKRKISTPAQDNRKLKVQCLESQLNSEIIRRDAGFFS